MNSKPNYVDDPAFRRYIADTEIRLQKLRSENDGNLDAIATATLRGQISELKRIIKLAEAPTEFLSASNVR